VLGMQLLVRSRPNLPAAALMCVLLVYAAVVSYVAASSSLVAVLLATAALAVAVAWNDVTYLAVVTVPGVWLIARLPGVDVSLTDVLVTAAGVAALVAGAHKSLQRPARILFVGFGFYLMTLSVSVLANHSVRSDLEVLHRIGIVGGGIVAGALLVRAGKEHHALRALLVVSVVFSVAAIVQAVSSGFQPAFPFGYHKNFLGSITATTLLAALAAGSRFRLPRRILWGSAAVVALGLAASQSRAAMLAVALGTALWLVRVDRARRRRYWKPFLALGIAFGVIAGLSLSAQVDRQAEAPIDSITQRIDVETQTRVLWEEHPVAGVGIRFFALPEFAGYQPPNNVLNEILAEAGFPGLLGFLVFAAGSVLALWRCQGELAIAGTCVVAARFAHGLVDIYWIGGTTTLPWLIAGMGLAAAGASAQARPGRHRAVPALVA
jgi:hypothetical protein